jgi:hypothetical protein
LFAACANKPPPLLTLGGRACTSAPALESATPIAIDDHELRFVFSDKTPCFGPAGEAASAYVAYRLPAFTDPYIVDVTSEPVGMALFSPRLVLLDADGKLVREIPRGEFTSHNASLHAALRVHPDEHYLLVASDPKTIGQLVSRISETTQSTLLMAVSPTAVIAGTYHSGDDSTAAFLGALNGTTVVNAKFIPKAK